MKKILLVLALIVFPFTTHAAEIGKGITNVDFDGDGVEEIIVKGWRENFNAHGFYGISFYKTDEAEGLALIEVGEEPMIYTMQGAECITRDYWIVPQGKGYILVAGYRKVEHGYAAKDIVEFEVYTLQNNKEELPGTPRWFFSKKKSFKTTHQYCDVNEAFEAESKNFIH